MCCVNSLKEECRFDPYRYLNIEYGELKKLWKGNGKLPRYKYSKLIARG